MLTSAPATVSIAVTTINHAPTTGPTTISDGENQNYIFQLADFPFADPNDLPPNTLAAVIFETLPGVGTIADNNVAITAGQAIAAADIAAGKVVFTPSTNAYGSTSFTFAVRDNGGTANGGLDTSGTATATLNIAQRIDHAPTTSNVTIGALQNTAYVFALKDFPFADPNDTPANSLQAVVIVSLPGAGSLSLNGQAVVGGQVVQASDIAAGKLTFLAASQATGRPYASFSFEVQDNGDTSGGGSNSSAAATATINVTTPSGAVIKTIYKNGVLYSTETDQADGSYDIRIYVAGTFNGVAYASHDNAFTAAKFRDLATYYDASGNVVASESFLADGGYTITIGGVVRQQKTVNPDGSFQIAYTGVTGAAFTSYTVQYGTNGKPVSASYSNGMSASWTFNADGSYQIAYTGVTGGAFTSYTVQCGSNGKPVSASYSNGMSASWTYNADGSYQIAFTGVTGATFTSYTVQYGTNGRPVSASYSNGMSASWTFNADGSYQIAYTGVTGAAFTSYTVQFASNGRHTTASYSNGMNATWTYNADGSYQVVYGGVTGAAYASYTVQYGSNTRPTTASYSNGLNAIWAFSADGSYLVTFSGVPGTFEGRAYATYTLSYTSSGFLSTRTYYNSSGGVVATITYSPTGGPPVIKLAEFSTGEGSLDEDSGQQNTDQPAEVLLADAEILAGPVAALEDTGTAGSNGAVPDEGAPVSAVPGAAPRSGAGAAHPGQSPYGTLAYALLGGILLPAVLTGRPARPTQAAGRAKPLALSTFDLLADRFDPLAPDLDTADLPCPMLADDGVVDWIVMNERPEFAARRGRNPV